MNKRHKHADVIHAWAEGEEVEWLDRSGQWNPFLKGYPPYDDIMTYRVKPKRVKKEGWVNVYPKMMTSLSIFEDKATADEWRGLERITCVRIEWEEEL